MSRVGLLGGTFDPVHHGHLKLALEALRQLKLDHVYLVLSPRSPFKLDRALTPVSQRLKMLRRAIRGRKKISIGRWELNRRGPSYTVDTLLAYKKRHPNDELFLILGSDAFMGFGNWKQPEKILKLVTLVVGRRPKTFNSPPRKGRGQGWGKPEEFKTRFRIKGFPLFFWPIPAANSAFLVKKEAKPHPCPLPFGEGNNKLGVVVLRGLFPRISSTQIRKRKLYAA